MPRKARITVPGAIHHLMSRGNEGRTIYLCAEDRQYFLNILEEQLKKSGYLLYAWCLMDNHYHLLVRINEFPLGVFMRQLNGRYAQYFRKRTGTRGYLFQDRYRSIVTQDQAYIEQMVRYIHLNPIRGGVCKSIEKLARYPWCGHSVLIGMRKWPAQTTVDVLKCFAAQKSTAVIRYTSFVKNGINDEPDIYALLRKNNQGFENIHQTGCWVIGNQEFVQKAVSADMQERVRLARHAQQGISIDEIALRIARKFRLGAERIQTRGRENAKASARKVFAFVSNRQFHFKVCEIARFLNIRPQSVSHLIQEGEKIAERPLLN